jgi:hypothetical protein
MSVLTIIERFTSLIVRHVRSNLVLSLEDAGYPRSSSRYIAPVEHVSGVNPE